MIRPVVAVECSLLFKGNYYGNDVSKQSFQLTHMQLLAMQVAMLFEVCGRDSDIGFDADPEEFMRYHTASCDAFERYACLL